MIEVSVIIPTHTRTVSLKNCLEALAASDFPPDDFEVIVVDDGSPDPVAPQLQELSRILKLVLLRQENEGAGAARNLGARHARGPFLAFTDDDCLPEAGWLRAIHVRLAAGSRCALGGETKNAAPDNVYARVSHLLSHKAYGRYEADPSAILFLTSNNFAMAQQWFEQEGGFHEGLRPAYEDRELSDRLVRSGYRLVYAPDAVVGHHRPMTLLSFLRQHMGYGRAAFVYYWRCQGSTQPGARFFLFRAMREAALESCGWGKLWAPLLVMLSQAAALAGMIRGAAAHRATDRR